MKTAELFSAARSGDSAAFSALVTYLQPQLFRWAIAFANSADDAEDIVQDTCILLHRRISTYRATGEVNAWVYQILRRAAADRYRTHARRARIASSVVDTTGASVYRTDPGARVDRESLIRLVHAYFDTLPPRQREVFDLVDLQGYEPAEVAKLTGQNASTVRAHLFKARASVRAKILARATAAAC